MAPVPTAGQGRLKIAGDLKLSLSSERWKTLGTDLSVSYGRKSNTEIKKRAATANNRYMLNE